MAKTLKCSKCGAGEVMEGVQTVSGVHETELRLRVFEKPKAALFKGAEDVPVMARVCGECGFTEFYAQDPEKLLATRRRFRRG